MSAPEAVRLTLPSGRQIVATRPSPLALAIGNFAGAAQEFEAAGLYAAVAGGAALLARAIAPPAAKTSSGSAASSSTSSSASSSGSGGGSSSSGAAAQPTVSVYIAGHLIGNSGIQELTEMINEAVQGRDVRLIATQTTSQKRARQ
jgi:hypothetical protein